MVIQRLFAGALVATLGLGCLVAPAGAQTLPTPARQVPQPNVVVTPTPDTGQALPPPPQPAILPPVPPIATEYRAPNPTSPAAELVGIQQTPFVGIKLEDAVTMALQKNTDLAIAQSNQRIANYQIVAAQGAYDIRFQLQPSFQHSLAPPVSSFQAGPGGGPITQDAVGISGAVTAVTKNGGRATIGTSAQRVQTDSTIVSFSPQYLTAVSLQFTQPLLRGAAANDTQRQLLIANANGALQRSVALAGASTTIAGVSNAYWDLVAAWRNVAIQEAGLRNASVQAASNARLAQRGAVAPVDVIESNTQINVFQDNVLSALQNVQRLQNQLKTLILSNPADPTWSANLVPTTNVAQVPDEPKLDDLIVRALVNRPEVGELRAQRQNVEANLAYAKDQLKPQLDLSAGYTSNGFAGQPTSPTSNPIFGAFGPQVAALNALIARANAQAPPGTAPIAPVSFNVGGSPSYLNGRYGKSYQNLFDNRFPTYTLSLTLQLPLRNRTAKAQYDIAQEQGKQIEIQELSLLQRLRSEATNALQTLRSAQYRLVASHDARVSAERVLQAEQRRYSAGTSTTFLVLQRGIDVANQQGRELQAQTDLNKAVIELNRVGGTIFSAANFNASDLGVRTLDAASPFTSVLPTLAPASASPPPVRR